MLLCFLALPLASQSGEMRSKSKNISINIGPNEAENKSGFIEENAEIEGITIINGKVTIDGVKVPRGVKQFRSVKTGKSYFIDWGKGDDVSISEH